MLFSVHVIISELPSASLAKKLQSGVVEIPMLLLLGEGLVIVGLALVVNSNVSLTLFDPSLT